MRAKYFLEIFDTPDVLDATRAEYEKKFERRIKDTRRASRQRKFIARPITFPSLMKSQRFRR